MATRYTDLPAAAALDGSEILAVVQSGDSVQTTAQAIADLGGGSGASVNVQLVDTSTASFNLDLDSSAISILSSSDALTADTTATRTNTTNSALVYWQFEATGADGIWGVTIPGITSDDGNFVSGKYIPKYDGLYTVQIEVYNDFSKATFIGPDSSEPLYKKFDRKTGNYVLALADKVRGIEMNVAGANTVTVPLNATVAFPIGTVIPVIQYGAGLTSIVATGGVTINTSAGNLDSPGQYAPMFLRKIATNEWYLWNGTPGGSGAVDSVNGQTGVVVLDAGDIANTPSGTISATTVQAAIDELDSEKQSAAQVAAAIDSAVASLLDFRGTFDASGGAYPSSGGSGTAGAILKADTWIISVAGTLPTGQAVQAGDLIFAIIDTPGNTQANWGRIENNLTYVPVNKAGDTMSGNLAMGSNKVTGLAAASGNGEAVRFEQLPAASSETVSGLIEIATQAEVTTGTDDLRAVTPLKLATATRGVQDVPIPASGMWPTEANGCTPLTRYAMATSLLNIQVLEFPVSAQTFAQCTFVLPRKYNNGTITAVVYWKPSATGSGDVRWGIQLASYRNDDALTVAFGTEIAVADTYISLNDLHITSATAAITPSGTVADGNFMALQINRDPGAGSDTLDVGAQLLSIVLRVTTDSSLDE